MGKKIILDPGHGGFDGGAVYGTRKEKDDTLRVALALGKKLEQEGYDICYTRKTDQYDSPFDKVQKANQCEGDLFLSIHRNLSQHPNLFQGVVTYIYEKDGIALELAEKLLHYLQKLGFDQIGVEERKELVVLRRTKMPALVLELGFLDSAEDNHRFDGSFEDMMEQMLKAIKEVLPLEKKPIEEIQREEAESFGQITDEKHHKDMKKVEYEPQKDFKQEKQKDFEQEQQSQEYVYYIQIGLFRYPENAVYQMEQLKQQEFQAVWRNVVGLIAIWVGEYTTLDDAVQVRENLQELGYETLIVTEKTDTN